MQPTFVCSTTDDLAARIKPYFLREGLEVDDAILIENYSSYPRTLGHVG